MLFLLNYTSIQLKWDIWPKGEYKKHLRLNHVHVRVTWPVYIFLPSVKITFQHVLSNVFKSFNKYALLPSVNSQGFPVNVQITFDEARASLRSASDRLKKSKHFQTSGNLSASHSSSF